MKEKREINFVLPVRSPWSLLTQIKSLGALFWFVVGVGGILLFGSHWSLLHSLWQFSTLLLPNVLISVYVCGGCADSGRLLGFIVVFGEWGGGIFMCWFGIWSNWNNQICLVFARVCLFSYFSFLSFFSLSSFFHFFLCIVICMHSLGWGAGRRRQHAKNKVDSCREE